MFGVILDLDIERWWSWWVWLHWVVVLVGFTWMCSSCDK